MCSSDLFPSHDRHRYVVVIWIVYSDEWSCATHLSAPSCASAVASTATHCRFFAAVVVLVEPLAQVREIRLIAVVTAAVHLSA